MLCMLADGYLGLSSTQHINHNLHDRLVHAQSSHQVWVLIEHLIVHDVAVVDRKGAIRVTTDANIILIK